MVITTIVTGLGCSGKSTYAKQLADKTNDTLVHLDTLVYGPNWVRVPVHELRANLTKLRESKERFILEGIYFDPSDANGTMVNFMNELMHAKALELLVVFDAPTTQLEQATRIMTRTFGRLRGQLPPNETGNAETPASVARLMEKTFAHFKQCAQKLDELIETAKSFRTPVDIRFSPPVPYIHGA
jgi:adenylate kinase family enzyme